MNEKPGFDIKRQRNSESGSCRLFYVSAVLALRAFGNARVRHMHVLDERLAHHRSFCGGA